MLAHMQVVHVQCIFYYFITGRIKREIMYNPAQRFGNVVYE